MPYAVPGDVTLTVIPTPTTRFYRLRKETDFTKKKNVCKNVRSISKKSSAFPSNKQVFVFV